MSRGAKRRNLFEIFDFPDELPEPPKPRPSIRPNRHMSVTVPPNAKGKLTTAERLMMAKKLNGQRLTQSISRQKREREKAEACRKILKRRNVDPTFILDLTDDAQLVDQPNQPTQPDELVSDDDEDEQDFVQPTVSRKLFTSPEKANHAPRQVKRPLPQHRTGTYVTEVSDHDENTPGLRLKKRRVAEPRKRVGVPVNSAVFAPCVRDAIRSSKEQNKPASADLNRSRVPLKAINESRKYSEYPSKDSTSPQCQVVDRKCEYPTSNINTQPQPHDPRDREMVLHISTIPATGEDVQEIHQISDDDDASSRGDRQKQRAFTSRASQTGKASRQALKRPRHGRQLNRSISTGTFYGKKNGSKSNCHARRRRVAIPLRTGQTTEVPSKEIAQLTLQEPDSSPRTENQGGRRQKPARRHGRIRYESSDGDDEATTSHLDIRFKPLSRKELETVRSLTFKVSKAKVMAKIPQANIELKAGDFSGLRGSRWLNDEILNSFVALINARSRLQVGSTLKENHDSNDAKIEEDDEIMEVAVTSAKPMEVFRRPRPRTHVFNTFFFPRLSQNGYDFNGVRRWLKRAGRDIKELDLIMFPINLSNFHWVLAAIDLRGKQFLYLDSTYGEDSSGTVPLLRRWLHDELTDKHGETAASDMQIDSWGSIMNPSYLPRQKDGGSCGIFTLYMAEYLERGRRPDFTQENIRTLRQRTALFLKHGKLPDS